MSFCVKIALVLVGFGPTCVCCAFEGELCMHGVCSSRCCLDRIRGTLPSAGSMVVLLTCVTVKL